MQHSLSVCQDEVFLHPNQFPMRMSTLSTNRKTSKVVLNMPLTLIIIRFEVIYSRIMMSILHSSALSCLLNMLIRYELRSSERNEFSYLSFLGVQSLQVNEDERATIVALIYFSDVVLENRIRKRRRRRRQRRRREEKKRFTLR